ncbi:MAG: PAS domain-containing protein [Lachnospiraceae bacterium]|nr:PAS domain-containing protein [Lachnospiraceae bacterium]
MDKSELYPFLFSMAEEDRCAIVICNLEHQIIYMNPAAGEHYSKWGGMKLMGQNLLQCHNAHSVQKIEEVFAWFRKSREHNRVFTFHNEKEQKDVYMVALRDEEGTLIGYYEKHEYRTRETMERYGLA